MSDLVRNTRRMDAGPGKRKQQDSGSMPVCKRPWSKTETGSPLCWRHGSLLDIYCCTDDQIICGVCASAEHRGHTIGLVRGERKRKQEELKYMQVKSKQFLKEQEKKWGKLMKTLRQTEEEARNAEDYCESIFAGIIDSLQRDFLLVKELIGDQEKVAAAQVQSSLQTLRIKMEEMRKRSAELERLAQTDNDVRFLQEFPPLLRLCEKDLLHPVCGTSQDPFLSFESTKSAVEEFERQLREFCDERLTSISQSGWNVSC